MSEERTINIGETEITFRAASIQQMEAILTELAVLVAEHRAAQGNMDDLGQSLIKVRDAVRDENWLGSAAGGFLADCDDLVRAWGDDMQDSEAKADALEDFAAFIAQIIDPIDPKKMRAF